jgi:hypothetical protein
MGVTADRAGHSCESAAGTSRHLVQGCGTTSGVFRKIWASLIYPFADGLF